MKQGSDVKKIALVFAVVLVSFVCGQEFSSTTSPDTVYMTMKVKMTGAQWAWDIVGNGLASCASAVVGAIGATDTTYADFSATSLTPCCSVSVMGIVENTGGITLDLDLMFVGDADSVLGDHWAYDAVGFSVCPASSGYSTGYEIQRNAFFDGDITTPDADIAFPTFYTDPAMTPVEIIPSLPAEDPWAIGDGPLNYEPFEIDCCEIFTYIRVPATAINTNIHILKAAIVGRIAS
jgi:hypothetical protein